LPGGTSTSRRKLYSMQGLAFALLRFPLIRGGRKKGIGEKRGKGVLRAKAECSYIQKDWQPVHVRESRRRNSSRGRVPHEVSAHATYGSKEFQCKEERYCWGTHFRASEELLKRGFTKLSASRQTSQCYKRRFRRPVYAKERLGTTRTNYIWERVKPLSD